MQVQSTSFNATINGLNCPIRLRKSGKIVQFSVDAAGALSQNEGYTDAVIPEGYRPIGGAVTIVAKNVTAANLAVNYGTTRYIIETSGRVVVTSDSTGALERLATGCWITD